MIYFEELWCSLVAMLPVVANVSKFHLSDPRIVCQESWLKTASATTTQAGWKSTKLVILYRFVKVVSPTKVSNNSADNTLEMMLIGCLS